MDYDWHHSPCLQENEQVFPSSLGGNPRILRYAEFRRNRSAVLDVIRSCGQHRDLRKLREAHSYLLQNELFLNDTCIGNTLLSVYAKCGAFQEAETLIDELPVRNVVSWTALISGYSQHGLGREALDCFRRMQDEGITPNPVTFICVMKACGSTKSAEMGRKIHLQVSKLHLLETNPTICTALVDMYIKCGLLQKAKEVFDKLTVRNIATWNALIAGYARHGFSYEAFLCFQQMRDEGLLPDAITFICMLKVCGRSGSLEMGEEIHAELSKQGLSETDVVLGTALINMYAKCGELQKAQEVFDKLPTRNVVSWSALIDGYVQHGLYDEALMCFRHMQNEGISPNAVTYICVLKACSNIGLFEVGEQIHAEVRKQGLLRKSIELCTSLVDMYAKCGMLEKAQQTFEELPVQDVISWSALIAGYAENGHNDKALMCFREMRSKGFSPNTVTFSCILKACSSKRTLEMGKEIHAEVLKQGLLEGNMVLGTALLDMYAKCGSMGQAEEVFEQLPQWSAVCWNAMITGYAENGHAAEALDCFHRMQNQGTVPDSVTYICILKACGCIGSLETGEAIHREAVRQGLLDTDIAVGNALVDMYAKCGVVAKAQELFDALPVQNIVTLNALIAGFSQMGNVNRVWNLVRNKMMPEYAMPSLITFLVLLTLCNHAGLIKEGEAIFEDMNKIHSLSPTLDHTTCMVDLLSRAGCFDKAMVMIDAIPSSQRLTLWLTLLAGCQKWSNVDLARWVFELALQLDEECVSAFVCMGNMYSSRC